MYGAELFAEVAYGQILASEDEVLPSCNGRGEAIFIDQEQSTVFVEAGGTIAFEQEDDTEIYIG